MTEYMSFLNDNSGAMMVVMTFVYVVATIAICYFNWKSATASLKQVEEARAEFEEANRAFITVDLVDVRSGLEVLKIQNNGKRFARNVNVCINEEFVSNLIDVSDRDGLRQVSQSYFSLGIGQSRYVTICGMGEFKRVAEKIMNVTVRYQDSKDEYKEVFTIDMKQHGWELIYESPLEDMRKEIKGINESVKYIKDDFRKVANRQN